MSKTKLGEWMWRFLAVVMMFSVGWTIWIIYQLNPPPLIMSAAFEAAAKARGKAPAEKQSAQSVSAPSGAAGVASAPAEGPAEAPAPVPKEPEAPVAAPKEPAINPDKLKFSETIAIPGTPAKK